MDATVALLKQLQTAVNAAQWQQAATVITPIKIAIIQFPIPADESQVLQQTLIAREAFELSCLTAIALNDVDAFERSFQQLKPYYFSPASSHTPVSERQHALLGVYLLSLLAHNRIAEFHTELEVLPTLDVESIYVKFVRQLEQHYMEGSYHKVLQAVTQPPLPFYTVFLNMLSSTVRDKVADCCEKAYQSLPLANAASMLFIDAQQVQALCAKRGWTIKDNNIFFTDAQQKQQKVLEIPSRNLIQQTLEYAHELERIV